MEALALGRSAVDWDDVADDSTRPDEAGLARLAHLGAGFANAVEALLPHCPGLAPQPGAADSLRPGGGGGGGEMVASKRKVCACTRAAGAC